MAITVTRSTISGALQGMREGSQLQWSGGEIRKGSQLQWGGEGKLESLMMPHCQSRIDSVSLPMS